MIKCEMNLMLVWWILELRANPDKADEYEAILERYTAEEINEACNYIKAESLTTNL